MKNNQLERLYKRKHKEAEKYQPPMLKPDLFVQELGPVSQLVDNLSIVVINPPPIGDVRRWLQ